MADAEMDWLRQNAAKQGPSDVEMEWLRKQAMKNAPQTTAEEGATQAAADTPAWQAPLVAAGKWSNDMLAGIRAPLAKTEAAISRPFAPKYAAARDAEVQQLADQQAQGKSDYAPLAEKYPMSTFAGEVAPSLMFKTPLSMAAGAALNYGTPQERALNAVGGFAGAKVGQKAATGAARLFGPNTGTPIGSSAGEFFSYGGANSNPWNIPLSVGQATGNKPAQIAESVLKNLPFSAGTLAAQGDRTFSAFNRAVSNTFGSDTSALTPAAMGAARTREGSKIGEIAARNSVLLDPEAAQGLAEVSKNSARDLGKDASRVQAQIDDFLAQVDQNGNIPGTFYKTFDTRLGQLAKGSSDGNVKAKLLDLRSVVRDAADRSFTETGDAAAWKTARKNYANLMTVSDAVKNVGDPLAEVTHLSPSRLLAQVNQAQPSARFNSGNDLADLAQWSAGKLPDKIPNSGTAQREFYQRVLSNPVSSGAGLLGLGYGLDQAGVGPGTAIGGAAVPLLTAKVLAGKGMTPRELELLKRAGGLLGFGVGSGNQ